MIPIVRTYRHNPIYLKNMYNDENSGGRMETYNQKVNIAETDNDFRIDLIAPGYSREEIKVTVDAGELTVSSEEQAQKEEKNYLRKEFNKESFSRTFKLPENVEADKIEATHNNGILSISLPKRAKVEIPVQQIEVK